MKLREKILVGLMIAAMIYGAYTYLDFGAKSEALPIAYPETGAQGAQAIALTALQSATQSRLNNLEWYTLESALGGIGRNPFHRLETMAVETARVPQQTMDRPEFRYEGYMETDGLRFAIINGRAYAEGEFLKEQGYVVIRIVEDSVLLAHRATSGMETWRQEFFLQEGYL